MVKYSCERCGKEFSQKSHYDSHNRRKTHCENNADKIKALVDKAVEKKLKELNKKLIVENKEEVIINTEVMDTHQSKQPKKFKIKMKLISDGDVAGALLVTDRNSNVDLFLGTGGGPEGVIAASALDAYNFNFKGRFIFSTDEDKARAKKMGIVDLNKKYNLKDIIKGDSIFSATGITSGDLVKGVIKKENVFLTESLVTHKSQNLIKKIEKNIII